MVLLAAVLATLLVAPSLFAGLAFDDFFQKLRAQGKDAFGHHPLDIFTFCWGPADVAKAQETGMFPWFTQPHTRLAFFRPLASLTHYLDYTLWPHATWLMHLQNLAWYATAVALVAALYRRVGLLRGEGQGNGLLGSIRQRARHRHIGARPCRRQPASGSESDGVAQTG